MKDLFTATSQERDIIEQISTRSALLYQEIGKNRDTIDIQMDIEATHCNGCPLHLEELLEADDFNLMHDISGIAAHLNRRTGKLEDLFSPRFSRKKEAS